MKYSPRIILHPNYIRSQRDGGWHYINAKMLADLYEIDYNKCIIQNPTKVGIRPEEEDIHLHPLYEGNYSEVAKTVINKIL